jgi:hypothetical protein
MLFRLDVYPVLVAAPAQTVRVQRDPRRAALFVRIHAPSTTTALPMQSQKRLDGDLVRDAVGERLVRDGSEGCGQQRGDPNEKARKARGDVCRRGKTGM